MITRLFLAALLAAPLATAANQSDPALTLTHGGVQRRYRLHRPPRLTAPAPLVIVLHGGGSGAAEDHAALIRRATRFDAKADAQGFLVAYPEAIEGHWNDGRGLPRYRSQAENIDDVGFIAAMVEHIASRASIDRRRVFIAGASNGAMMAYRIGCERPEPFAGIAAVIGNLPVRLACNPNGRLPVLIMNGTEDRLMPWSGGQVRFGAQRLGEVLSTEATVRKWADASGCGRTPVTEPLPDRARDGTRVFRVSYTSCRAPVVLYRVEGGGHGWPGGPQQTSSALVGRNSRDINATDEIWSFFEKLAGTQGKPRPQSRPFGVISRIACDWCTLHHPRTSADLTRYTNPFTSGSRRVRIAVLPSALSPLQHAARASWWLRLFELRHHASAYDASTTHAMVALVMCGTSVCTSRLLSAL